MPPKLIIFIGAPEASMLNWDESNLLTVLQSPLARFCGESEKGTPEVITASNPSWSLLSIKRHHLTNNKAQFYRKTNELESPLQENTQISSFLNTSYTNLLTQKLSQSSVASEMSTAQAIEQALSQFYEESYIRHEDEMLSHPVPIFNPNSTIRSSLGSDKDSSVNWSFTPNTTLTKDMPIAGCLTDIKDIPTAAYLDSIYPQTISCDIIVGIISITEARVIKVRRGGTVGLTEVLVGDETKSGFTINFWLNSSTSRKRLGDMNNALSGLQAQDIVLIRNVALNCFQGKVFGQSLRRELTKVHLLDRDRSFGFKFRSYNEAVHYSSGSEIQNIQAAKANRVLEWLIRFVMLESA